MSEQHTPGPWNVSGSGKLIGEFDGCPSCGKDPRFYVGYDVRTSYARPLDSVSRPRVCNVAQPFHSDPKLNPVTLEEAAANAKLIAAAPDLLAALQGLLNHVDYDTDDDARADADAAIAKAVPCHD